MTPYKQNDTLTRKTTPLENADLSIFSEVFLFSGLPSIDGFSFRLEPT